MHASVCRGKSARGEAALRAKACCRPRPAAALRARGETARGKAVSCRGLSRVRQSRV